MIDLNFIKELQVSLNPKVVDIDKLEHLSYNSVPLLLVEIERLREALKEVHIENKKLKKDNNVYKLLEIAQPILKLGIPITEQKLSRKNPQLVKRRLQVKQMQRGLIRRNKEIEKLREALSVIQNSDVWEIDGTVEALKGESNE